MNGRTLAAVLWRRRWAAWLTLVVVAVLTALWLVMAPRKYTATALVVVAPQPELAQAHATAVEQRATLAQLAHSVPMLAAVRADVGGKRIIPTLLGEVSAGVVPGTEMIRVSVEDADRHYARDVANAIVASLPRFDPSPGQFRFIDAGRATGTTSFSSPDVAAVVWIGIAAALVLPAGVALAREAAAGTVDDPRQVEALAQMPVLARIPRPADATAIPADSSAGSGAETDAFRALRVALEFATSDNPTHTVVVAPVTADESSAWLVVNLATALAQVQHRVLVIDADFGNRIAHPALRSKGPGLAEVLRGEVELRAAVRPCTVPGVSVLGAGRVPRSSNAPANLIEMHFHKALGEIDNEVDLILVNAAPLTESDDAEVMAVGNALLLVVRSGAVRARRLRQTAQALRQLRLRVAGAVLVGGRRR